MTSQYFCIVAAIHDVTTDRVLLAAYPEVFDSADMSVRTARDTVYAASSTAQRLEGSLPPFRLYSCYFLDEKFKSNTNSYC